MTDDEARIIEEARKYLVDTAPYGIYLEQSPARERLWKLAHKKPQTKQEKALKFVERVLNKIGIH
ncbi:MAG: hypothetical protein SVY53_05215 [Chloroflexota bacterium]|nr:hypothetical protein [Chloroflexota bacterium]